MTKAKDNLELYNKVREVPREAQKNFNNGRFQGTDINPMWRIKELTTQFGMCGIGWYYEIVDKSVETIMASDDVVASVEIKLYVKVDGEWSKPITGIGGSKLASSERKGLYVNDDCFKMCVTDAISVACKQLGFGADIYWQNDNDKYTDTKRDAEPEPAPKTERKKLQDELQKFADEHNMSAAEIIKDYGLSGKSSVEDLQNCLKHLKGEQ